MAGKSHKPLFDLIGDSTRASNARPGQLGSAGAAPGQHPPTTSTPHAKPTIRLEIKPAAGSPAPVGSPAAHAAGSSESGASSPDNGGVAPLIAEMTPATSFDRRRADRGRRITDHAESSGGGALWDRLNAMMGESTVILPKNLLYVGTAALIVVSVVIWLAGIKYGQSQESERWSKFGGDATTPPPGGAIVDPLSNQAGHETPGTTVPIPAPQGASLAAPAGGDGGLRVPEAPSREVSGNATQPQPKPSNATFETPGAILTSAGWTLADTRVAGLNYLNMGTLAPDEAERAVAFFHQNGVEVLGVPIELDRKAKSSKNADPPGDGRAERKVVLFAALGVTPDLLKTTVCQNLETKIAALGQSWLREYRGSTNFGRPLWTKYTPAER